MELWSSLFNELTNTALFKEEVGEVARIMARKYGEQSKRQREIWNYLLMKWQVYFLYGSALQIKQALISKSHLLKIRRKQVRAIRSVINQILN